MKTAIILTTLALSLQSFAGTVELSAVGNTDMKSLVGQSMKLLLPKAQKLMMEVGTTGTCETVLAGETPVLKASIDIDKNQAEVAEAEFKITGSAARYGRVPSKGYINSGDAHVGYLLTFEGTMSGQQVYGELFCNQISENSKASANTMLNNLELTLKKSIQILN